MQRDNNDLSKNKNESNTSTANYVVEDFNQPVRDGEVVDSSTISPTTKLRTLKMTAAAIRMRSKRAKMTELEKTVMLYKNAQYKRKIRSCSSSPAATTASSNKTPATDKEKAADATRKRLKHSKLTDEEKALVYIKNQEYRKRISIEMKLNGSHHAYREYERIRKRNREIQKLNEYKEKSLQESLALQKANAEAEIEKKKAEYDAMPEEQREYIQAMIHKKKRKKTKKAIYHQERDRFLKKQFETEIYESYQPISFFTADQLIQYKRFCQKFHEDYYHNNDKLESMANNNRLLLTPESSTLLDLEQKEGKIAAALATDVARRQTQRSNYYAAYFKLAEKFMTEQPSQLQPYGPLKDRLTFNNDQLWRLLTAPKLDTGYASSSSSSSEEEDYSKYDNDYHYSENFDYNLKDPYEGFGHYDPYSRKDESLKRLKEHEYESMWGLLDDNNDDDDAAAAAAAIVHSTIISNSSRGHRRTQKLKVQNGCSDGFISDEGTTQRCGENNFEIKIQYTHDDSAFMSPIPEDDDKNAKHQPSYPPFLKGSRIIKSPQSSLYNNQQPQDLNNLLQTKVINL
jgi:hypothetical protein